MRILSSNVNVARLMRKRLNCVKPTQFGSSSFYLLDASNIYRHSGSFGITGSTKTTNRIATAELRLKYGFKVVAFDMQNELEFLHFPCPVNHPIYPKLKSSGRNPEGLNTHVLLPLAYDGGERVVLNDDIPNNWDFFLLDLYDIDVANQDWNVLLSGLSGSQEQVIKTALLGKQPSWGVLDVYMDVQKRFSSGDFGYPDSNVDNKNSKAIPVVKSVIPAETLRALNRKLIDLNASCFLAPHTFKGHKTPFLLDWEKEILDKKCVTVLKVSLLPPKLRHAFCTYILRKTFDLAQKRFLENGRKVPPVAFMIPEATDFFPKNIPEEYRETLPPLRDVCYSILRKGRRHRVVIDFDTADFSSMSKRKVIDQLQYLFLFDNTQDILENCLKYFNIVNSDVLSKKFDLLKVKGNCISLKRHNSKAVIVSSPVPGCWVPCEGEDFVEIWKIKNLPLKPVGPFYERLNEIFGSIKDRLIINFEKFEKESNKKSVKGLPKFAVRLAQYLHKKAVCEQGTRFVASQVLKEFFKENADSPSKVTLYNYLDKLEQLKLLSIYRQKKPYQLVVSLKELKHFVDEHSVKQEVLSVESD